MNIKDMIQQAGQLRERMAEIQKELSSRTVEASVGGGMVTVVANGKLEIVSVRIEKEIASGEDVSLLQDLVRAGVNEALSRSRELIAAEMAKATGGILPPGMFP
jgi:DNA-binding YbaB/EbfC family protein